MRKTAHQQTLNVFYRVFKGGIAIAGLYLVAGLLGCTADQAEIRCQAVPDSQSWMNFIGHYVPTDEPSGTCDDVEMPLGEPLYLFTFSPEGDSSLNVQGIKSGFMGDAIADAVEAGALDDDEALQIHHSAVAVGTYTAVNPDKNGICSAPTFSGGGTQIPSYDNDDGDTVPALEQVYEWSNFRVYVTPEQIGMQFEADLALTINGCTGHFHVQAVVPEIDCGDAKLDNRGDPVPSEEGTPIFAQNNDICTDRDSLIDEGTNPDIALECVNLSTDPDWPYYRCVPAKPFPSNR